MPAIDLAVRLQEILSPDDLRLSGAALYRWLAPAMKGEAASVREFLRLGADRSMLIVRIESGMAWYGRVFFLFASGDRVKAIPLPLTGDYGATLGPWRRQGDRIVGTLFDVQGNWGKGAVAVFARQATGWRLADFRETEHETAGTDFAGLGVESLNVSTRSYDFRILSAPHTGPLLTKIARWNVWGTRINVGKPQFERDALYELDLFADAILRGDARSARLRCEPKVYAQASQLVRKGTLEWEKISVKTPDNPAAIGHRFYGLSDSSLFFELAPRRGGWRIVGFRLKDKIPLGNRSREIY